jgi:ketosteroid isomerase-like protein
MKRTIQFVILSMLVLPVLLSQMGCATENTNRAVTSPAANTNAAATPIDKAAIEAELMRIERDFPRVMKEKDIEAIRRVEADDAILVYPDGKLGSKEQDLKDIEAGAITYESWDVVDLKANVLDADAAVISGRAIVKGGKIKLPDGKTMDISGQYRFVDTFAKRNGQWKLVAGAGVPVRDPSTETSPIPSPVKSPAATKPTQPPPSSPKPTP